MLAIADSHGVDVLLLTFVTNAAIRHPIAASDEYIFALAQHNEVTRRIAAMTGTAQFDLAAVFPDDSSLFTDGRHMTKAGNRIRAQLIGDFIMDRFLS